MKKRFILLFILHFCCTLYSQKSDESYNQQTKLLLDYIVPHFLSSTPILVNRTAAKIRIQDCELAYASDKLNKIELEEVVRNIAHPEIIYWTSDFFPLAKIVDGETIKETFKDSENGWNVFREKFGDNIAEFSAPIFLRNYQVALIKFSIVRDYLSGVGYEAILFKTEEGWSIAACSWDS